MTLLFALFLACTGTPDAPSTETPSAGAPAAPTADDPGPSTGDPAKPAGDAAKAAPCRKPGEPPAALTQADQSAQALNEAGFACYQAGDLDGAALLWAKAVSVDGNHALARYNLACATARLNAARGACNGEYEAHLQDALTHLEKAVSLDAGRKKRMVEDADLANLRSSVRYRLLAGGSADAAGRELLLTGTTFYSPPQGMFGSLFNLDLKAGGVAVKRASKQFHGAVQIDPSYGPVPADVQGTWKVDGDGIAVTFGKETTRYTLKNDALLDGGQPGWFNLPDECSA